MSQQPFTIGILREITDLYEEGEISYGKMVEMLNEVAIKWHNSIISKMGTVDKKMTAVEWLIDCIGNNQYFIGDDLLQAFKQAKAMEKEQIKTAYNDGADHMVESKYEGMDNYYKLRYGSDNQI